MKKFISILAIVSIVISMFSSFVVFADGETIEAPVNLEAAAVSDTAVTITFDRPEGVEQDGEAAYCDHYVVTVYDEEGNAVTTVNTKNRTTLDRLSTTYYNESNGTITVDKRGYWRRYRVVVITGLAPSTSYTATVKALNKDESVSSLESLPVSFTTSPSRSENKDVLVSLGASFVDNLKRSTNVYSYQMARVENLVNGIVGSTKDYYTSTTEWTYGWLDYWSTSTAVTETAPISATIDIGTPSVLSKIEVVNPLGVSSDNPQNIQEYNIYLGTTTSDLSLYTTVTDNLNLPIKTIEINSQKEYRYVKIEVTKGYTDGKVRICELKVYSGEKQEGLGSINATPANATIAAKSDMAATITFDYVSSGYDGYYVYLNNDYTKPYVTTTDLYNAIVINNLLPNTQYLASVVGYKNNGGTITMTNPAEVTFTTEESRFYKAGVNIALGAEISGETSTSAPIERAVNGVYGDIGYTAKDNWNKYGTASNGATSVEKLVTVNLKNGVKISSVAIVQPSTYNVASDDASSFVVYGSTNGENYTQIATGSGEGIVTMDVSDKSTLFKYIQVKLIKELAEGATGHSFRIGDLMIYSAGEDVNKVLSYDVNYTEDEENDTLSVDLTYVNATSETQNFVAILALYNNDKELINAINLPKLNIASKQSGKISLPCSYAGQTLKYAKTFIWKGLDNIMPIASVYEYTK